MQQVAKTPDEALNLAQKHFGAYGTHTPRDKKGQYLGRKDYGGNKDVTEAKHRFETTLGFRTKEEDVTSLKGGAVVSSHMVKICKYDQVRGIVYGVVYAPDQLDCYGEFMIAEDIETMAHRYMRLENLTQTIDTQHDNEPNGCYPIESYIARKTDEDYPEGAWVLGVKLTDDMRKKVDDGEINGFSFQCMVKPVDVDIEYEMVRDQTGGTESAKSDTGSEHEHVYFVELDDVGRVVSGKTDVVDGHSHKIGRASVTEPADGHTHRFFL